MWFRRCAAFLAILCGLAGAQAPEFVQQYGQRLGGTLDEVRRVLADFDADATAQGLSRSGGIARLESSPDVFVKERGAAIVRLEGREQALAEQLRELQQAGPVGRLIVVATHFDPDVAAQAARNFTPAVPLTIESALTAFVAFICGLAVLHGLAWPVRRSLRARRNRSRAVMRA